MGTRTAIISREETGSSNAQPPAFTPTAGDAANDHEWPLRKGDRVRAKNTGVGAQTITLVSSNNKNARSLNGSLSVPADDVAIIGPLDLDGWIQADGNGYIDVTDDTWDLSVMRALRP